MNRLIYYYEIIIKDNKLQRRPWIKSSPMTKTNRLFERDQRYENLEGT